MTSNQALGAVAPTMKNKEDQDPALQISWVIYGARSQRQHLWMRQLQSNAAVPTQVTQARQDLEDESCVQF